jgi:hypothetical protein
MIERVIDWAVLESSEPYFKAKDVTFLRDFGPWKAGYECIRISIDFMEGTVTEYDLDNKAISKCEFDLTPREVWL